MSLDPEASTRSSALTSLLDEEDAATGVPQTPTPQDSISNRPFELPSRPHPERTSRLPNMPSLTERSNGNQLEAIQAMMTQMQDNLKLQLTQQQRDFETRMETLFITKGQVSGDLPDPIDKVSASSPRNAEPTPLQEKSIEPNSARVHHSPYVRHPSYPHTYASLSEDPTPHVRSTSTKIKASDLPKFKGEKEEDVEVWIEQVSAIFESLLSSRLF